MNLADNYKPNENKQLAQKMLKLSGVDLIPLYRYEEDILQYYSGSEKTNFSLDENDKRETLKFTSSGFYLAYDDLEKIINTALKMIEQKKQQKESASTQKRLSAEEIKELKRLYRQGYTKTSIAEKFGISVNSVTYHVGKRKK